jgi:2'-5' RNA ligase
MVRLFIAVNCNDETKTQLLSVRDCIKAQSIKGNFSRAENLHLTLAFLGETPEEQIPLISRLITQAATQPPVSPFALNFTHTGCFKHSNKELWWIGADSKDPALCALTDLRQKLAAGLLEAGIKFDNRAFNPHITLGREIKHSAPIKLPETKVVMPVDRISLMKSEHLGGKLVYTSGGCLAASIYNSSRARPERTYTEVFGQGLR